MRIVAGLGLLALIAIPADPARAEFVMCMNPGGVTPAPGTIVPPFARLVRYIDANLRRTQKITATIDGKPVPITTRSLTASPFAIELIEIDSERTGTLAIRVDDGPPDRYTVKPVEIASKLPGVIGRFQPTPDARESFDGLVIRLPAGTPAILATVRLRRDADATWVTVNVPVFAPPAGTRPMIRIGQFDCEANYPLLQLAAGVDLEAVVTMVDGSRHAVTGLAPHLTLPAPLPPQPRPKNQRPR